MDDKFEDYLARLKEISPPADLSDGIILAVDRQRRRARLTAAFIYASTAMAVPGTLWSIRLLFSDLSSSPFAQLLQLAATDSRQVFDSFGAWLVALLEALPIGTLTLFLGFCLILLLLVDRLTAGQPIKKHHMKGAI